MSTQNLIKFDGSQTPFKVLDGASLLIPEFVSSPSPTNASSGVSPATIFDSKREGVGGMLFMLVGDAAGNAVIQLNTPINPGDTVAMGAIGGGVSVLTVTRKGASVAETIGQVAATDVAVVLGFYA